MPLENCTNLEAGELSSFQSCNLSPDSPCGIAERKGLHSFQRLAYREMGQLQIGSRVHGPRDISGIFRQSERPRSCVGARERCGRGLETDRQGQDIQDKCKVCNTPAKDTPTLKIFPKQTILPYG